MSRADQSTLDLVFHTKELYSAILRARGETSALVLKDLGDAIYDAVPWEDLSTPIKQSLVSITRELRDANTQKAIRDIKAESGSQTTFGRFEGSEEEYKEALNKNFGRFAEDDKETEDETENKAKAYRDSEIQDANFTQTEKQTNGQASQTNGETAEETTETRT